MSYVSCYEVVGIVSLRAYPCLCICSRCVGLCDCVLVGFFILCFSPIAIDWSPYSRALL